MGRKRNSHRPPEKHDLGYRGTAGGQSGSPGRPARGRVLAVAALLLLAVGLVFGPTVRYGFVNYDDNVYVSENPHVARGLTVSDIVWVFTHRHCANWHPLTGLSHLVDCQLYGLDAAGHHATNVVLHAATVVAWFLVLWRMTGGFWLSALAAAIFAVHPLRVESVAWVAERKDVLSGLCFVLTLGTYVWYARSAFSWWRYLAMIAIFALGLMAKPMLVTLPFVLLLLDYWPLERMWGRRHVAAAPAEGNFCWQTVIEKLSLLVLAAASCAVTVWAQKEALLPGERLPFPWRAANALVSYVAYVGQFFCPMGLAVFYPHPGEHLPLWQVAGAAVVLAGATAAALAYRRQCPYLLVGWLWYLGMLVPVVGLVQVGLQAMADRYTYLPQMGLAVALVWGAADLCRSGAYRRRWGAAVSALVLAVLMGCAWWQTTFWRDSETLWTHALACTPENVPAHNNLGNALSDQGRLDEAITQYQQALEIKPDDAGAHNNLGAVLVSRGRFDEAMNHYRKVLEIDPHFAKVYKNIGFILAHHGRLQEAIEQYRRALDIEPDFAEAYANLGLALAGQGRFDEAMVQYRQALEIQPRYPEAYNNLGLALQARGKVDEATRCFQQALEIKPDFVEAHSNLGMVLAARRQFDAAMAEYHKALAIKPDYLEARNNLGYALAQHGRFAEAVSQYRKALEIAPNHAMIHGNLGNALTALGQFDDAIAEYRKTLAIQPKDVGAHFSLGNVLAARSRFREAAAEYRKAVELEPRYLMAHGALAWLLATCPEASLRDGAAAIEHARRAEELCGGPRAEVLDTLAAAYAEAGRFAEAVATARKAVELAKRQNNSPLVRVLRTQMALYEAGKPYHETPSASPPARSKP